MNLIIVINLDNLYVVWKEKIYNESLIFIMGFWLVN